MIQKESFTVRFLSDMGEALDWIRQVSLENGWKALKIRIGPGVYFLIGNHPDAAQVMLRAGQQWFIINIS